MLHHSVRVLWLGCHERSKIMKHLLSGTALAAALAIALPVWAQTTAPITPALPAPAAAAPAAPMATSTPHKRMHAHHRVYHRAHHYHAYNDRAYHPARPGDIANQLNAQQLGRAGSYAWGYDQGAYGQP